MARKTLGFVPLIWVCAYCNTKNPGPIKSCTSCGAPQPDDVAFMQVEDEEFNFIKDEALIRMAKAGPDIHCPYCGTRNPATAELCSNCGGDLSVGGKVREAGQEVRTFQEAGQEVRTGQEVQSPPPAAVPKPKKKRSRLFTIFAIVGALAVIACLVVMLMLFLKTDTVTATVTGVRWERSIAVEAYTMTTERDWWDEVPEGAEVITCTEEYRYTSDEPEPNATEVCGEERVEDTGTGIGEVVQDCTYQVYDDYCEYEIMDWIVVDTITESGENLEPAWPITNLTEDQRLGTRDETYTIAFTENGDSYTYTTSTDELFLIAEPGSTWLLEVNQFGGVQSIEPAN